MGATVGDQKGKLYLGREYDLKKGEVTASPVLYQARHLTTHAIILGMTGSGKTGLGVILLEEVLLQGIPVLILDPKGDICNLLLTFPDLRPEDFAPWVDLEGARRRGVTVEEYGTEMAEKWRDGLAEWGITGERIARLRQAAEFTIFTPGSRAGRPVDVLHFFDTPAMEWEEHEEALRERVGGIVSALLGLVGVEADPLQSPAHILLARIVEHVWRAGKPLNLPTLIRLLQKPPFQQVGVFELETFFPEKDRFALARSLNNLIAAPGFETWQEGVGLDVKTLLYAEDGRPRASVFYLAHLDDAQRLFFITLFLEAVRDWLRAQSGTTDLRALLYFDELFGYFPPYPANPPTKVPLLALVKQGRSAGLGVVLATQNPADLDYKGLTNAGTWAVGSLRAERDKARVLEGLEGAMAEAGATMDRRTMDQALGVLKSRIFLFHDIHSGPPLFFHTRWAMSYLRGPLTRKQVRQLTTLAPAPSFAVVQEEAAAVRTVEQSAASSIQPVAAAPSGGEKRPLESPFSGLSADPSTLPPDVPQVFLLPMVTFEWALHGYEEQVGRSILAQERRVVYIPHLLAMGTVRTLDRKRGVDNQEVVARLVRPGDGPLRVNWDQGQVALTREDLSPRPLGEGLYGLVPATLARSRDLKQLEKDFSDYLYHNISTTVWYNPVLDLYGLVGESPRDFRVRCEAETRRRRDEEVAKARTRMDREIERVEEKLRREQRELAMDQKELEARKQEELLTLGESAFNLLTRRRSSAMISRSSRKRTLTKKAEADVEESLEAIEDLEDQLESLRAQWEGQVEEISDRWVETLNLVEECVVKPRRADVTIEFCGLAWVPTWRVVLHDGSQLELVAREM
ncbi:MAG TPA: DUF853 family protein [Chloroflexi bacterium]|nr:DUF853 family protein [Chloroflexota bacterium]